MESAPDLQWVRKPDDPAVQVVVTLATWVERGDVTLELVDGEGHALLRKARWWHRRVTAYVMDQLDRRIT